MQLAKSSFVRLGGRLASLALLVCAVPPLLGGCARGERPEAQQRRDVQTRQKLEAETPERLEEKSPERLEAEARQKREKTMRSLQAQNPFYHFRVLPAEEGKKVVFNAPLSPVKVNSVEVQCGETRAWSIVKLTSKHPKKVKARIWISYWDDDGRFLAKGLLLDVFKPGETKTLEEFTRLPEILTPDMTIARPTIVSVSDDRVARIEPWHEELGRKVERKAIRAEEAVRGPRPKIPSWGGICKEVDHFFATAMWSRYRDIQYVGQTEPLLYGDDAWCVGVRFREWFGAPEFVLKQWGFVIRNGKVDGIIVGF